MKFSRLFIFASLAIGVLVLLPVVVHACGGFFGINGDMFQTQENIVYTVNGDGTLTTIIGISYEGEPEEFSWILPVPSLPTVDIADMDLFEGLRQITDKRFIEPFNPCPVLIISDGGGLGGGGGGYFGSVGPYDFIILEPDTPANIMRWIRESGYQIPAGSDEAITHYAEQGMYFVAMKLNQDFGTGDITPVSITFEGDTPMIPIRMAAAASVSELPIFVWIFADTRYQPANYAHPTPDYTGFDAMPQLRNWYGYGYGTSATFDYVNEFKRLQALHDGHFFVTEFAAPTDELSSPAQQANEMVGQLASDYAYLTRLRGLMSPVQMTLDPIFEPAPDAAMVSRQVDLNDYVDPVQYWGCSSRSLYTETVQMHEALLPQSERLFDRAIIRYPDAWVRSEFTVPFEAPYDNPDASFVVYAPRPVTEADVRAYYAGEAADPVPMLLVTDFSDLGYAGFSRIRHTVLAPFGYADDGANYPVNAPYRTTAVYEVQSGNVIESPYTLQVSIALLVDRETAEATEEYAAMLSVSSAYQYYLSSDFRHTLFLNGGSFIEVPEMPFVVQLPYPEGWIETLDVANQRVVLYPEDAETRDPSQAVYMELYQMNLADDGTFSFEGIDAYGLTDAQIATFNEFTMDGCLQVYNEAEFEYQGRSAYIRNINWAIGLVVWAGPEADIDSETLRAMAATSRSPQQFCG